MAFHAHVYTQEVHDDGTLQLAMDHDIGAVIFAPFNGGILVGGSVRRGKRASVLEPFEGIETIHVTKTGSGQM
jgi:aryl-alcohol dehydrogenase-like predicted oxidoreductase